MGCTDCSHSTLLHFLKQETSLTETDMSLAHVHCSAKSEREEQKERNTACPPLHTFMKSGQRPCDNIWDVFDSIIRI